MKLICCLLLVAPCWAVLDDVVQWSFAAYDFPPNSEHERRFQPENTVITGLEVGWENIYLATPRLRTGIPATISYIPRNSPPGSSPLLKAFPDWSWHPAGAGDFNCSGIISVYRVRADRCDRLWVLDSGVMDSLDNFTRVCPPKLLIFDMRTHRPIRIVRFPDELLRENTLFTNLVIDETTSTPEGRCNDAFAYISDTAAPAMIVYDGKTDSAWRVTHASMYPDPAYSSYRIGEDTFELNDGVVGLAFSPVQGILYFQPLATDRTFMISTEELRRGPPPIGQELNVKLAGRKSSQGIGLAVDPLSDTLFYSPLTETAVASWNPHTNQHELLAYDPERLQFLAEVRWIERDGGSVWVLASSFHKFFLRTASPSAINLRVMRVLPDFGFQPQGRRFYRQTNSTLY